VKVDEKPRESLAAAPLTQALGRGNRMKPKGLKETSIIMCIFNLAAYVFVDPKSPYLAIGLSVGTTIVLLSFVILWHYWHGKNWARVLVMITSLVSILNLLGIKKHNMAQTTLIVMEAVLGVYLLWWLNVRKVKSYFLMTPKKDA
jgi:hypothetical protein